MTRERMVLTLAGLTQQEVLTLSDLLSVEPLSQVSPRTTRIPNDLVSGAFILGIINATPAVIKAVTDFLVDTRKNRYFTIKLSHDNGATTIEGAATPERISQLAVALKQLSQK